MIAYTGYIWDARVRREAETLALNHYRVTFLVPKEGDRPRKYDVDNVEVVEVNVKQYRGRRRSRYFLSYLRFLLSCLSTCTWRCLRGKVDIVHVHNMPNFLVFASFLPRLVGKKVILDIHDTVPETYVAKFGDGKEEKEGRKGAGLAFKLFCMEEALCCRFAHKIICVNHTQKDALVGRGIPEHKLNVSLNVPDHRRFGQGNKNGAARMSSALNLVYHGTLAKRLGIDLAIQAVARVSDSFPEVKLHILGVGEDEKEFAELSISLGLQRTVLFKGFVPIDGVVAALRGMQIGVIANRKSLATELMLPVKLLEYVALGIPVVAPRLKAIQRYFGEDMVRYYEPEDVDDLARAILDLHNDSSLCLRQSERAQDFLKRYGWERHQQDLLDLYRVTMNCR